MHNRSAQMLMRDGLARLKDGQYDQAEAIFRDILKAGARNPAAQYNLGVALANQARPGEAGAHLIEGLLGANAGAAEWKFALDVLLGAGDFAGQVRLYRRLIALQPQNAAAHYSLGNSLRGLGQMDSAAASWQAAVALKPDMGQAHNNLGTLAKMRGDLAAAASAFRAAIFAMPDFGAAHRNLGTVLEELGDLAGAEDAYRRALALEPEHPDTRRYLGGLLCEKGRPREAFAMFMDHARRRYSAGGETDSSALKAAHDREQGAWLGEPVQDLSKLVIYGGERLPSRVINLANGRDVAKAWRTASPQVIVIDDFLSADALVAIRDYCLGSTFWRQAFPSGYMGALPEHGFAAPLLAQLGEELADAYPLIFWGHPLLQIWAFKYCGGPTGIKIHADFAAVNVNFWITPDQANRNPSGGGLVIWDKAAPPDWDFKTYNNDEAAIRGFLSRSGARSMTVPYRANRAVIFDSDLFHETDAIDFHEGYANHRINITLLYGWRGNERS